MTGAVEKRLTMTNEEKQDAIARTGEILGIGAAGVTTVLATNPYLVAIAQLFPMLGEVGLKALVRRSEKLWDGVRSRAGGDESAARERLNASSDNHSAQDAVLESLRRVQDALDPEVVFSLGRLLWPYATGERKPDRFFRSMGKLLTDIDAEELKRLRDLLRAIVAHVDSGTVSLQSDVTESVDPHVRGIGFLGTRKVLLPGVYGTSLFPLLKRHDFAQGMNGLGVSYGTTAEVHVVTARSILEIIDVDILPPPNE